jgi:hypothetical protein
MLGKKRFVTFLFLVFSLQVYVQGQELSYLRDMQERVDNAFVHSIAQRTPAPLDSILNTLETLPRANTLVIYWNSYTLCMKHIVYTQIDSAENRLGKKALKYAYDALSDVENKNSEEYALLAFIQSLSTRYAIGEKAAKLVNESAKNAQRALALDSLNLRAWYALAHKDYYTPQVSEASLLQVEKYLLKVIALPSQEFTNPFYPSWGKENAYELLLEFYRKKNNKKRMLELLQRAKKEYSRTSRPFIERFEQELTTK